MVLRTGEPGGFFHLMRCALIESTQRWTMWDYNASAGSHGRCQLVGTEDTDYFYGNDQRYTAGIRWRRHSLGGAGNDTLTGHGRGSRRRTGNDVYVVDTINDMVTETAGQGTDTVQSSLPTHRASNLENLTLTGSAFAIKWYRQFSQQYSNWK